MRASNVYYLSAIALRDAQMNGYRKKFIFDPYHLKLTEDPSEDIIPDTVDLPAIYRSATASEIDKVNKTKSKQVLQQTPPSSFTPPDMNANLQQAENILFNNKAELFE